MKAYEVKKGEAEIKRGRVMMAIEGEEAKVNEIDEVMAQMFGSCDVEEEGDKEGEIVVYFMIDRSEKKDFMNEYKKLK